MRQGAGDVGSLAGGDAGELAGLVGVAGLEVGTLQDPVDRRVKAYGPYRHKKGAKVRYKLGKIPAKMGANHARLSMI